MVSLGDLFEKMLEKLGLDFGVGLRSLEDLVLEVLLEDLEDFLNNELVVLLRPHLLVNALLLQLGEVLGQVEGV